MGNSTNRLAVPEKFTDIHRQRLDGADIDTLLDWSEQVLGAQSIDEVFH